MEPRHVVQDWVAGLPFMQQSVLLCAIRGPDGVGKDHPIKLFCRWLRRCVLYRAFDGQATWDPHAPGGGSFTGPWPVDMTMETALREYLRTIDELPHHYNMHLIHAAEVLGYKHPDPTTAEQWREFYYACCKWMHLHPEDAQEMDFRLGDSEKAWRSTEVGVARDELGGARG